MKGYPGHLAAVEYARCLLTVQKKEGYRQAKKSAKRAKELLLLTDAKVYRVGQMVGYEDKFYFSRIFKRVTGMTPVEFKNQRREG